MVKMGVLAKALLAVAGMLGAVYSADAGPVGVSFGLRIGGPVYYPRSIYYAPYYPYYYRPAAVVVSPVVVEPAPVFVQPAPVVLQPAPVARPAPVVQPVPPQQGATQVIAASSPSPNVSEDGINRQMQLILHADEKTRADAAMQLGRLRAERAIDSLASLLTNDRSAQVRESAARALGLIGTQRALPALRTAAQSDPDRDVRRSAQYTLEIIHSQLRGN